MHTQAPASSYYDKVEVELYLRCKANPRTPMRPRREEATRVFIVDMERSLERLPFQTYNMLVLAAQGYRNEQIARLLGVTPRTVKRHLTMIC